VFRLVYGDLFEEDAEALVNAVNCVGVMGGGIALAFKGRYPRMFEDYAATCRAGALRPGALHVFEEANRLIINFPTKDHFRNLSTLAYIRSGLVALEDLARSRRLSSIAMPALGCGLGGLRLRDVRPLIGGELRKTGHDGAAARTLARRR
jgi:O-acetyl-ADP-ribose deacetylase (regulator of RNase III)